MAGIGFSLRKILSHDTLTRTTAAYSVAGLISGGPWLISVFSIILLAILVSFIPEYRLYMTQFQVSITFLVAGSLIFSGLAGDSFSRYAADQIFSNRSTDVLSNLNGMLLVMTTCAGVLSFLFVLFLFPQQCILYRLSLMSSFVVLSNIWVVISLLTGLKDYKVILKAFFFSYIVLVSLAYSLRHFGLEAFMYSFLLGQLILWFMLMVALYKNYPTNTIISFHFLKKGSVHRILILIGFIFNLAVWVDKFIFWYSPSTSYQVIGPFRGSWFYDLPIFIAYLCSVPGMAVFLLLIETNFSDDYKDFHEAIRWVKSFEYIKMKGEKMGGYAMNVIYSILKIQAIVIILVFQFGSRLLEILHLSSLYTNVLYVAVIGTSLQVVLLALISILFHMDRLKDILLISIVFLITNLLLTISSLYLGPFYYGFGFTCALMITCSLGMYLVNEEFTDLEYKVIMLR